MSNVNDLLSGANWTGFLLIVIGLLALVALLGNAAEAVRKLLPKKCGSMEECERRFADDLALLRDHDKRLSGLEEGARVQCTALHALLEHELHNGNAAEMQEASKALFTHLNK